MDHFSCSTLCIFVFSLGLVSIGYGAAVPEECKITEKKPPPSCCKQPLPKLEEYENKMKTCGTTVFGELKEPPTDDVQNSLMECLFECFFNSSDLLTTDLKISTEKLKDKQDFIHTDSKWKPLDEAAWTKCFEKSIEEGSNAAKCKSGSFQLVRCMQRDKFFNCPKDVWIESEECKAHKELLEKCPNIIPRMD